MKSEMNALKMNDTYELNTLSKDKILARSRQVYTIENNKNGNEHYKGSFVAKPME